MKYRPGDKVYSTKSGKIQEYTVTEIKEIIYFPLIKVGNKWDDQRDYFRTREEAQASLDRPGCTMS
jgi:hypothetical protein